jgi:hypothetical protein
VHQYGFILFIHLMGITMLIMIVLKGSSYVLTHTEIKLRVTFFWLTIVIESILCQLHCRRPVCMVDSLNMLWFCPDLKKGPMGN